MRHWLLLSKSASAQTAQLLNPPEGAAVRSYPRNSPRAAARLIALAMIADGHVCRSELEAVRHADAEARLGLSPGELGRVMQELCEDLLQASPHHGTLSSCIDESLVEALTRELDDPALQRQVMGVVSRAVAADGHLADGERFVLDCLHASWREAQRAEPQLSPA
jgi:uncharacterized tellurite resistance protein B-like protein